MRILQLGDTHLGLERRTLGGPPGWCRADDHLAALDRALAPALRDEVDLVVHTGDVFDRSRPPRGAVAAFAARLRRVGRRVPVVVVAGNHDRRGLLVHLDKDIDGVTIVDQPSRLRVASLALGVLSHVRQGADWADAARAAVGGGVDLLVCHQGFAGATCPGITFQVGRPAETVDARHLPDGVPAILSGHIHPRQTVWCGGVPVVYAGSTERTASSETEAKGTVRWTLGRTLSWRFVDHPTRPIRRARTVTEAAQTRPGELVVTPPRLLRILGPEVTARGGILALPNATPRGSRAQLRLFG